MNKCPLVRVEWLDSSQPISSWKFLADYRDNPGRPLKCVSVGWMIRKEIISLTMQEMVMYAVTCRASRIPCADAQSLEYH